MCGTESQEIVMKAKSIFAALLLVVASLQTAWGQGFRVYKSDGTVAQFSLRTDSIVFYDGIGTDVDFGPFTPVNQMIVGTWYKTKTETVTFNENGTTDYISGATYKFLPYQGEVLVYDTSNKLKQILRVHNVTAGELVVSTFGGTTFSVWSAEQPAQLVTSITVSPSSLSLQPNETSALTATALPSDADNKEVEWTSSDEAVAVVGEAFGTIMVMAKGYGTCTITATAKDGSGVKGTCQVTVAKLVTSITVNPATLTLEPGKSQMLTARVQPSDATNKLLTWSSSNTAVATVNTSGMVTAVAQGTCTITATAKDGSGVKGTCQVTVKQTGINGHEYVEIGGLKWATMNVGATTVAGSYETCFGDYYAWGETQPRYMTITRSGTNSATFTWRNGYSSGYSSDNYPTYTGTTLDASHDAATANWGGTWRTPTKAEFEALAAACSGSSANGQTPVTLINTITEGGIYWLSDTQTIESAYTGVAGLLFVSASDISKRVFFPASGNVSDTSLYNGGKEGRYWSSSLNTSESNYAYRLEFHSSRVYPSVSHYRYYGLTVRPVSG